MEAQANAMDHNSTTIVHYLDDMLDGTQDPVTEHVVVDTDTALLTLDDAFELLDDGGGIMDEFPMLLDQTDDTDRIHTSDVAPGISTMLDDELAEVDMQEMLEVTMLSNARNVHLDCADGFTATEQWHKHGENDGVDTMSKFENAIETIESNGRIMAQRTKEAEEKKPQKPQKNHARQRLKHELEYLRAHAVELEQEFFRLQYTVEQPQTSNSAISSSSSSTDSILTPALIYNASDDENKAIALNGEHRTTSLWERIAKHQMEEKQKVEVENVKLKESLEGQLKIIRALEKLLRKRPTIESVDEAPLRSHKKRFRHGHLKEESIFEMLTNQLDDLYAQFEIIWKEVSLDIDKTEQHEAIVKMNELGEIYMQFVDARIVPFSLARTSDAVWTFVSMTHIKLNNGYYGAIASTDDMINSQFTVTMRLRRSEALCRIYMVIKRYIEAHRVVLVWATFSETEGTLLGNTERIDIRESGWTVIEELPIVTTSTTTYDKSTIMQTLVRMTPNLEESSEKQKQVGLLTDLIIGSYKQNLGTLHQIVENILMSNS